MQILTQRGGYITVHSVLSNVAKTPRGIVVCEQ